MKREHGRASGGFSLIELMIVVAMIGIIAAIAIPWLVAAKQTARAASAVSSLHLVHQCEASYRATGGRYGDLSTLSGTKCFEDPALKAGEKEQYRFTVVPDSVDPGKNYEAEAVPLTSPVALWTHYYMDATGVIRWRQGARAVKTDPPID